MGSSGQNPRIRARILTGTYTGNGADNRNINIGVDLTAKGNPYVIIKGNVAEIGCHRIEYAQGDLTMYYLNGSDSANRIQAFNSTGFQIGNDNDVNQNTITYRYIVFWEEM